MLFYSFERQRERDAEKETFHTLVFSADVSEPWVKGRSYGLSAGRPPGCEARVYLSLTCRLPGCTLAGNWSQGHRWDLNPRTLPCGADIRSDVLRPLCHQLALQTLSFTICLINVFHFICLNGRKTHTKRDLSSIHTTLTVKKKKSMAVRAGPDQTWKLELHLGSLHGSWHLWVLCSC